MFKELINLITERITNRIIFRFKDDNLTNNTKPRFGNLSRGIEMDDVVILEQLLEQSTGVNLKDPKDSVKILTLNDITLSGLQTLQGISLNNGDRVGVIGQTNSILNGIYNVSAGAWIRSNDFDGSVNLQGESNVSTFAFFGVDLGDNASSQYYVTTTGDIIVGTTPINFARIGADSLFNGNRPITRAGSFFGINPSGTTLKEFTENLFYPAELPQILLSIVGGNTLEFGSNPNRQINWTVTKKTFGINNIIIDGQSFIPNSLVNNDSDINGNTQNGNKNVVSIANVNTIFNAQVQAQLGTQIVNTSITLSWFNARYWGNINKDGISIGQNITDSDILASNGALVGTGKELSSTRVQTRNGINGQGNYLFFSFPSSFGIPSFVINGLPNTAWTRVRTNSAFINSNGFITNYDVWISNTVQNSPIALFQIN